MINCKIRIATKNRMIKIRRQNHKNKQKKKRQKAVIQKVAALYLINKKEM